MAGIQGVWTGLAIDLSLYSILPAPQKETEVRTFLHKVSAGDWLSTQAVTRGVSQTRWYAGTYTGLTPFLHKNLPLL